MGTDDLWRWADPAGQQRKVRLDELRAALAGGLIAPNTPVWRTGMAGWQPAHEVPELTSASLGGANGVVLNIPPPPLAMVAVQQEYEAKSGSIAPAPPPPKDEEPPPPPPYIPAAAKASVPPPAPVGGPLKTQLGGSAYVPSPAAPAVAPVPSPAPAAAKPVSTSLPTAIGLPPPPELAAAIAARGAASQAKPSVPPPIPKAAPSPVMAEELSGSNLLDAPTQAMAPARVDRLAPPNILPGANGASGEAAGVAAPTDPIVYGPNLDEMEDGPPRRPGLSLILEDLARVRKGEPPKNKLVVGVVAALALMVVIMLIAGLVSLVSGPSSDKTAGAGSASPKHSAAPALSLAAATTTAAPKSTTSPPAPAPTPKESAESVCTTSGDAKVIAPRAVIASGIEAQATGSGLALGFAATPREAVAMLLDPASLAPSSTVRTKPAGDARHVTPMFVGGKLTAMPDVDRKGDKLGGRRTVGTASLIDVGQADGAIVWAPHGRDSIAKLFSVPGDGSVEALRAVPLTDRKGIAIAFRQGNMIHFGAAKGDGALEVEGELSKVAGLGQVGSPAIAVSGDHIIVAWADRTGAQDDWKIRWTKAKIGSTTDEALTFPIPEGGLGGSAMSPSVTSLGGGKFLLSWTEGPVSSHQVRAIAMSADGSPTGSALAISPSGVNAGQPAGVVGADGRGAVAFIAARGKALEIHAAPINCSAR